MVSFTDVILVIGSTGYYKILGSIILILIPLISNISTGILWSPIKNILCIGIILVIYLIVSDQPGSCIDLVVVNVVDLFYVLLLII